MSTVEQAKAAPVEFNEEAIADYLQANPDFFSRHAELLGELQLPHSTGGAAISLIERQVSVLRGRNEKIETQLRDFMQVAQSNDQIANNIHALAIKLILAEKQDTVIETVEEQLRTIFEVDRPVLVLFDEEPNETKDSVYLRHVERDNAAMGAFKTFLQAGLPRCGTVRDAQRAFLFGEEDVEVGSVALIPLGEQCDIGFYLNDTKTECIEFTDQGVDFNHCNEYDVDIGNCTECKEGYILTDKCIPYVIDGCKYYYNDTCV